MFETPEFRRRLIERLESATSIDYISSGEVADFLQTLAQQNEPLFEAREVSERGIAEALRSADALAKAAADVVRERDGKYITSTDVERAFNAKFCTIWPFCR